VLVAGGGTTAGGGAPGNARATAELWDPASGKWARTTASLTTARKVHVDARLPDGRVLVTGGYTSDNRFALSSAEVFAPLANGTACMEAGECQTGFCVDGVCCDKACNGPCQACSASKKGKGADGLCEPYAAGTDPEDDCPDQGALTCGTDGQCNGEGGCRKYAKDTVCSPMTCDGASVTTSTCDGRGICEPTAIVCVPYACEGAACKTTCVSDADCAPGSACDVSTGKCFGGVTCDGDHTLTDARGVPTSCAPYRCEGSVCKQRCASIKDCAEGALCDSAGACVPIDSGDSAGGCHVGGGDASRGLGLFAALGVIAMLARRRGDRGQ
jgi:hypothetical protein